MKRRYFQCILLGTYILRYFIWWLSRGQTRQLLLTLVRCVPQAKTEGFTGQAKVSAIVYSLQHLLLWCPRVCVFCSWWDIIVIAGIDCHTSRKRNAVQMIGCAAISYCHYWYMQFSRSERIYSNIVLSERLLHLCVKKETISFQLLRQKAWLAWK